MKALFLMLLLSGVLSTSITFSQGKSGEAHEARPTRENSHSPSIVQSTETTDYTSRVYNECASEWVDLKGQVTYSIKEFRSEDRYSIMYRINLNNIKGKGETTGDVYKGGGIIMNKVIVNSENGHIVGKDSYRVRYKSPNSTFSIVETAHFNSSSPDKKVALSDTGEKCK